MISPEDQKVDCVAKSSGGYVSQQRLRYTHEISAESINSNVVLMGAVTIPPQGRTKAHSHDCHDSAFYLLSGEYVELCTGDRLECRQLARPGDYLSIPAKTPHVAVNRGKTPAVFVDVRNVPTGQENVVMLPELDALVS